MVRFCVSLVMMLTLAACGGGGGGGGETVSQPAGSSSGGTSGGSSGATSDRGTGDRWPQGIDVHRSDGRYALIWWIGRMMVIKRRIVLDPDFGECETTRLA